MQYKRTAAQLQPVVRDVDFEQFDLQRAFSTVQAVANQF
jgi:hypothetical protein